MQVNETVADGLKREFQVSIPAADLGAKADQPAAEAKPAPDKQEATKLAVPAKADQAAQAKAETPAAKPDAAATAAKRKEAADTTAVKTADQATAPANAAGPAKTDAAADAAKAAAAPPPPAPPSNLPPTPLQTVPIVIGLQALRNGSSTFQIRLDPEELGRIEVKLHISGDSKVSASLVVDRVETLHMLQREAKTLERAFDQAGLKANGDDLQFSLRQDGRGQNGGGQHGAGQDAPRQDGFGRASSPSGSEEGLAVTALPPALQRLTMSRALAGGLDIQI
jgi:flagellar hook-length control protein FliK